MVIKNAVEIAICIYNESMTKKLQAVNQRPQDLHLAIVTADKLPQTHTLLSHEIHVGEWSIQFGIIGESHRIRVQRNNQFMLEEMLACVPVSPESCVHHHAFVDLRDHHFTEDNYCVSVTMRRDTGLWKQQDDEMSYTFPAINGIEGMTRIQWTLCESSIAWRTYHSYLHAGDVLCVYSTSEYIFKSEG